MNDDEPEVRSWGVVLAVGVITLGLGVVLSLWPRETVPVVAFFLALHLIISGAAQVFVALTASDRRGPARWVVALAGVAALVLGTLLLVSPLQTLGFIGWAAGLTVLAIGVADLLDAVLTPGTAHRGWHAVRGVLEVGVAAFLLGNPELSLGLLVGIVCVWLIAYGSITIFSALALRSQDRDRPPGGAARPIT